MPCEPKRQVFLTTPTIGKMDQLTSFFHNVPSFFSPTQRALPPPPAPSYRGTITRRPSQHPTEPFNWSRTSSIVINRGLLNRPGENNCFLNAAIQVLWHIDSFRRSFRLFEGHTCIGETCIFCALKILFTQYQHSERASIPPDVLRNAMANCYKDEDKFQLGLMDDAAECFEKLLEQMHYHLTGTSDMDSCNIPCCVSHIKFALTTVEQTSCKCQNSSELLSFVEFVHYVSVSVIKQDYDEISLSGKVPRERLFDHCLHRAGMESPKVCSNPSCGQPVLFKRLLLSSPDVVCIGLIWDSGNANVSHIKDVINTIGLNIHLDTIFDKVVSNVTEFNLTALIAYYGRHYSTFCYNSQKKLWMYFDDAKFRQVGSDWSSVKEECFKSHYQPLLLVYTNPNSTAVDVTNAPKHTVPAGSNPAGSNPAGSNPASSNPTGSKVSAVVKEKVSDDTVPDLIQFSITPHMISSAVVNNITPVVKPPLPPKPNQSPVITDLINLNATPPQTNLAVNKRYSSPPSLYPALYPTTSSVLTTGGIDPFLPVTATATKYTATATTTASATGSNFVTAAKLSAESFQDEYKRLPAVLQVKLQNISMCIERVNMYCNSDQTLAYLMYSYIANQLDDIINDQCMESHSKMKLFLHSKKHEIEKRVRQIKTKGTIKCPIESKLYYLLTCNEQPVMSKPPLAKKPSLERTPSPIGPAGNRMLSPAGNRTPSPIGPAGNRMLSPAGNRTPSPAGNRTPSPAGNRTPSPAGNRTPSPAAVNTCVKCKNKRSLNNNGICGPCQLKLKIH